MDSFEIFHRAGLEILIVLMLFALSRVFLEPLYALILVLIVSHSIMWLVNGHFFALIRGRKTKPDRFIDYTYGLYKRLTNVSYLKGVIIFGGLCKGDYNEYSDLDLRVIRSAGFLNSIKACNYAFIERMRAFRCAFPLEVYVFDDLKELDKEDKTQVSPIILYDPNNELKNKYPEAKEFSNFKIEFVSAFVK